MIFTTPAATRSPAREAVARAWLMDESTCVEHLLQQTGFTDQQRQIIDERARALVARLRSATQKAPGLDAFLDEYDLSSHEGIVLMCLAEALLRIPDNDTVDRLIEDKLATADWSSHLGQASSLLVNAGTWGLMLTGRIVRFQRSPIHNVSDFLGRLVNRSGEPVIRAALREAMRILGFQFVMGQTITEAIKRSRQPDNRLWTYSFDMLGEAALTMADAERYFSDYRTAIEALAAVQDRDGAVLSQQDGLSIKLSALHPRLEVAQTERWRVELIPRVVELARLARDAGINVTLDAEEADRLEPLLDVFEALCLEPTLRGWDGLGIAVQAYQKRALAVIDWLAELAAYSGRRLMVRLVKGAYWDTEIKRAQMLGLTDYPVFTRKLSTDVSYIACTRRLLQRPDAFYPQFATHNAHTASAVLTMIEHCRRDVALSGQEAGPDFEFQRLHGMGESLFRELKHDDDRPLPCRVYAPVGQHDVLLAYLVRRLLENGANSSFVNRIADQQRPVDELIADPVQRLAALEYKPHPLIPLPQNLFAPQRRNSTGINLHDPVELQRLEALKESFSTARYRVKPLIRGSRASGDDRRDRASALCAVWNGQLLGEIILADAGDIEQALQEASRAFTGWSLTAVEKRASILEQAAGLIEQQRDELIALIIREGGRCAVDAVTEWREAIDYCRYYAAQLREQFNDPVPLPGPTGESNTLVWSGRGVFITISPWNFPLAIFTGQVAAALAAGNCVIAKPASITPVLGFRIVELLHQAGVPPDVLHYLPAPAALVERHLLADTRVSGVAFTGSTATAVRINRRLAGREGAIVPLIAETGGINTMIIDSSALLEQAIADVITSAFNSAGQRCSALRVVYIQQDIYQRAMALLQGTMQQLRIGDPSLPSTDIGPLIEAGAVSRMHDYCRRMQTTALSLYQLDLPHSLEADAREHYFPPTVIEINSLEELREEMFGPILHVICFQAGQLEDIIHDINNSGYGLTLGLHSRITTRATELQQRAHVGNVYVNRNMIGAAVGVQPFGGEGLSGTGPKAGGPQTLFRYATERCLSVNTAAMGGNAGLLSLSEE